MGYLNGLINIYKEAGGIGSFVIGILTIIGGFIFGIISGSFFGFIVALVGGIIGSVIYFVLAKILENQNKILSQLQSQSIKINKLAEKKICEKWSTKYDEDMTSCPYCHFTSN